MEIRQAKLVNVRALSWEIRKATGINCGGYNETEGIAQRGSINGSVLDGVVVRVPDSTSAATVLILEGVIDSHLPGPLPADFPVDRPPPLPMPDPDIAAFQSGTIEQKVAILGRRHGLVP